MQYNKSLIQLLLSQITDIFLGSLSVYDIQIKNVNRYIYIETDLPLVAPINVQLNMKPHCF